MAEIVLGLGTSHSPQLSIPPELWADHAERDKRSTNLYDRGGRPTNYEELLAVADPSIQKELAPEKWRRRHAAVQEGIAKVGEVLTKVSPDILLIVGDDQHEFFHDDNMPALSVYWGETIAGSFPPYPEGTPVSLTAANWARYELDAEREYPVASDLGRHIVTYLTEHQFDVAQSNQTPSGSRTRGMGHAFGHVYKRIMKGAIIPVVPIMLNDYYPPNQPTPKRCYSLGQALRGAVEAWDSDARVAVIASGGLSHIIIDEELDQTVIKAMENNDGGVLASLPTALLNGGTSEIRNWIVAAGAVEHLRWKLFDYVPCYRSPAGTGCGAAFAQWS